VEAGKERREAMEALAKEERRLKELKALIVMQEMEVSSRKARLAYLALKEENLAEDEGM